ncbi:hypothetical protein [Paractinoplanes durhamensis]|uniref:Uncharacterized protein n=1 Tax=Paractinoplanes durhamensis TaxID=113563 RepID=A0ABQ3Z4N3_9ACTN|nr:hypothetical protein [Actinoplanes durhamensis]GIE04759.1 hypothetical protein Adu01nite_61090 [Actinoplanes durhamensis]
MSIHEDHRPLDRDTAELLLRGDPAAHRTHPHLGAVLTAASSPSPGRHLAGEDAAVAAFAAAHLTSPRSRRIQMLKTTLAKLLTVKVLAAVAALSAGGVAVAAGTGTLPGPLHKPHHPRPPASASASHSPKPHPSGSWSARPSHSAFPAGDLAKLCAKWTARPGEQRGQALEEPEFGNLVQEAGRKDRDRVDNFCATLPKPSVSAGNGTSGKPEPRPSGSVRPSGSGNPGPRPADHPSGTPNSTRPGR